MRRRNVKLVWVTPQSEQLISHCARVSSNNQQNPEYVKLLSYCMNNGHWSVFEMASMCVEIVTSRAISAQILRHRSFSFQEFSQRYAETQKQIIYKARRQDAKNRQNSIDDLASSIKNWFEDAQDKVNYSAMTLYKEALEKGIAKEQARFLLPMSSETKIYMTGNIRSWIHYLKVRTGNGTQLEHQEIAENILNIIKKEMPVIYKLIINNIGK